MTINELYRSFLNEISGMYNSHEASNITSMVFDHFTGIDRAALIRDPGLALDEKIVWIINGCMAELKMHKPVQYITGEAWFYKMKLKVSPAVLIPRPETEELVETVIQSLKNKTNAEIIDIGTGSGCIAIAIKKNVTSSVVTAIDISIEALTIAKDNASIQHTDIKFLQADFLSENSWTQLERYNVIVSNPPYIPLDELKNMDKNVTAHEPHPALFVDPKQPLIFYERIAAFAIDHLKENGTIFLEIHEDFAKAVCNLFTSYDYKTIIKKDMFGKDRIVVASLSR